jgi:hypothetical protein
MSLTRDILIFGSSMDSKAAICILCLVLVVTSGASPHGNEGLKQAALHLLEWTESRGGEIFSEILLGKRL